MKCIYCGHLEDKVIDSRLSAEGNSVRRRRECLKCERRFTTYEYVEQIPLLVVKKTPGGSLMTATKFSPASLRPARSAR